MTKREMFVEAHRRARQYKGSYRACFSLALRELHEEAKSMSNTVKRVDLNQVLGNRDYVQFDTVTVWEGWKLPELEGSEKQVAWANDIRFNFCKAANGMMQKRESLGEDAVVKQIADNLEKKLNDCLSAKYWIDVRDKF